MMFKRKIKTKTRGFICVNISLVQIFLLDGLWLFDSGGLKESLSYNLFVFYFQSMLFHFLKRLANITDFIKLLSSWEINVFLNG